MNVLMYSFSKRLGRLAAFIVCCILVLGPLAGLSKDIGSDGKALNGMAPIYVGMPAGETPRVSADLSLPEKIMNQGWYANWIMLVDRPTPDGHEAFVQIGLIRRNRAFRLFVAFQRRAEAQISYLDIGRARTDLTFSKFSLVQSGSSVLCYYGGRRMIVITNAFDLKSKIYAQAGPEVYAEGDALVGDVQNLTVGYDSTALHVFGANVCRYYNHGLSLTPTTSGFHATGVFDHTQPSRFLGHCSVLY